MLLARTGGVVRASVVAEVLLLLLLRHARWLAVAVGWRHGVGSSLVAALLQLLQRVGYNQRRWL
jgi:hypothetical protein